MINFATTFQIVGWKPDTVIIPENITDGHLRKLLGNMICVPTIGTIELLSIKCFIPYVLGG